jgi:hypothetical protein
MIFGDDWIGHCLWHLLTLYECHVQIALMDAKIRASSGNYTGAVDTLLKYLIYHGQGMYGLESYECK